MSNICFRWYRKISNIKTCENVCFDDINKNLPYAICKMSICKIPSSNALFLLKKQYLILKKNNNFFSFLFFMQSFNFCHLLVQIFYLFQYIIQKRLFLWLEAATGGVFYEKVFLEIFAKFTGKHLCQSLLLNKVADLSLQLYFKRDSGTGVFLRILRNL